MGVWKNIYGSRSQDFIDGVAAGLTMCATWKDGKQVVYMSEKPLGKAIEEMEKELSDQ
jgi:hypothetical protein